MWIVRTPKYANAIVSSPWQRVEPQLKKLTSAYPQFQGYLKHQPVPQSRVGREDLRKGHQAVCIAPWANAVADRLDLCLFQGLDAICCASTGSKRTEDQSYPAPFLSKLREIERPAATAVFAIQRPLQKIFNNRQMLIEGPGVQFLNAAHASKASHQRLDLTVLKRPSRGQAIVEIEARCLLRPLVHLPQNPKVGCQSGGLNPVSPVSHNPAQGNTRWNPRRCIDQARQALSRIQHNVQDREYLPCVCHRPLASGTSVHEVHYWAMMFR